MSDLLNSPPHDLARPNTGPTSAFSAAGEALTIEEAAAALRVLRHGGVDESTAKFDLPPAIRATVSPVIAALRWAAVLFGMVFAAADSADGDLNVVATTAIVLFYTTWRTFRPIRLASENRLYRTLAVTDGVVVGAAVGLSGGFESPFIFCVMAVAAVGAFGWGVIMGIAVLGAAIIAMAVTAFATDTGLNLASQGALVILGAIIIVVALLAFARDRLLDAERKRVKLAGRLDILSETNDLLHILNQVARTLPTSLDIREALSSARDQIHRAFDSSVVCVVVADEDEWIPQLTDGCALAPMMLTSELPAPMRDSADAETALLVRNLDGHGLAPDSGTGIYAALRTRGKTVGLLAVEHPEPDRYNERDLRLVDGLGEVLALTVDNARWFRRLRSLGAEEERSRIARDLHDRLGQWLTYISFELERIMSSGEEPDPELDSLYNDVQSAIDELRETLRQLRTGVTEENPLGLVARELITGFTERTGTPVTYQGPESQQALKVPVENELLRILQEALNNIDKHADATKVEVSYTIDDDVGELVIADNGKGFDIVHGVRESAYGLVGMRERADVIGAKLSVDSAVGAGTTITVVASNQEPS